MLCGYRNFKLGHASSMHCVITKCRETDVKAMAAKVYKQISSSGMRCCRLNCPRKALHPTITACHANVTPSMPTDGSITAAVSVWDLKQTYREVPFCSSCPDFNLCSTQCNSKRCCSVLATSLPSILRRPQGL